MGTRVLIVVLFVLSILTSSALTYLLINKTKAAGGGGDVGKEVATFIENNPEVIIKALRNAQNSRAEKEARDTEKNAMELRPQLENGKGDGQAGNKDGDVAMIAFIDHNCGYCRRSIPDIEKLIAEDTNIKFVLKDLPILGPLSVEKAKASLAIARIAPEKWYSFYTALDEGNFQTPEQVIALAAEKTGIDAVKLKSEMESKDTANKISENQALAEQLFINGTPVFIVNGTVIRGAAGLDAFRAAVAQARAK